MSIFGCGRHHSHAQRPVCGGTTSNTNYNAPKVINSDQLTSILVQFYLYGEYGSEGDRSYWFDIKPDESGKLMLTDDNSYPVVSFEVNDSILAELQKVIAKYNLAKKNGIDEYTNGLPPEFQPCYLSAKYESGESLYFRENNDPDAEWAQEFQKIFANEFAAHGDNQFLPPKETKELVRFEFEYSDPKAGAKYMEINRPKEGVHYTLEEMVEEKTNDEDFFMAIEKMGWTRNKEDNGFIDVYNIPDENYYAGLQEILEKVNLKKYANHEEPPFGFEYNTPYYYSFYVEYKYGNRLWGFSTDEQACQEFIQAIKGSADYIDAFIAKNPHDANR